MELVRYVKIEVEVDTNKATYRETFTLDEDGLEALLDEVREWIEERTEV